VTLYVRGRDIEESEMAMQFDKSSCRWTILGTAADVHRSDQRTAVLKALETAGADGMSVAEIMAATGSQNRNLSDVLLFRMAETGEVTRIKRGVYARNLTEPSSGCKIGKKERFEDQDTENTTENSQSYNLTNLTAHAAVRKNGVADYPDMPSYLRRDRLGPPALGPGGDDLGDLR
jgi:hypothetical protein